LRLGRGGASASPAPAYLQAGCEALESTACGSPPAPQPVRANASSKHAKNRFIPDRPFSF